MNIKVSTSEPLNKVREITDLKDMLYSSAELYKNNIAFKYKENEEIIEITYAQLKKDVDALGTAMLNLDLKDKKIAVIGLNSYKWVVTYLATVAGIGTIVPIDKALPPTEIRNLMIASDSAAVLFDSKYIDTFKEIKSEEITSLKHLVCFENDVVDNDVTSFDSLIAKGNVLLESDTSFVDSKVDNKAIDILLFTSGTTSNSKAVELSHYNICSNIMSLSSVIPYREDDTLLSLLPMHHTFGSTVDFLTGLYSGSCIAICEGLRYILPNLVTYKISILNCVPLVTESIYKKICEQVESSNGTLTNEQILGALGGKLRFSLVGAAALGKDVILGMKKFGITICQGYGLTETSPVLSVETHKNSEPGSIGYAIPGVTIAIDNPDTNGLGEIICKGPNVMRGYYNNEEATNEVFKDGWFHTGDLGYVDVNGFLFISGRKKNVIVLKNGKNIFPEEIEVLLNNHPLVAESFVYAAPTKNDIELRAKIVYNKEAIISAHGELPIEEIQAIFEKHRKAVIKELPLYKIIRKISITDEPLIKTTTNKIKRNEEMKKIEI